MTEAVCFECAAVFVNAGDQLGRAGWMCPFCGEELVTDQTGLSGVFEPCGECDGHGYVTAEVSDP